MLRRASYTQTSAFLSLLFASLLLSSCSTPSRLEPEEGTPPPIAEDTANLASIVILGTNDLHGALLPQELKTREENGAEPIPYEAGGAAYLASYAKILRSQLGDRLLWLDAGDEFQGSIESNHFKGAPVVQFFNQSGLNAATVGNHEFDFGASETGPKTDLLGAIRARMSEANYPFLSANIAERASGERPKWPNFYPSKIYQPGRLKVGVIGLTTRETPSTTLGDNVASLKFTDLKDATLREARALREQGAQVIVADAHVGLKCERGRATAAHAIRKPMDPQGECNPNDELVKLLRSLPKGTLDAVVAGHSHQVIHHWVAGTPVIQGGAFGRYFNLIYLTYDLDQKKVIPDRTRIEGPIPVCPKVFKNQNDCNGDRPAPKDGRGKLVTPTFRGEKVSENSAVMSALAPYLKEAGDAGKKVIAQAARPIDQDRFREAPLGNLVADAIRGSVGADVAFVNAGGIRANLEAGDITYEAIFRTMPFENSVSLLEITGRDLKTLLQIAESGSRGYWPVSGVKLRLIDPSSEARSKDLNQDGRIELWEVDRLIEARLSDEGPIEDRKTYRVATLDFLAKGGDDMAWIMSQIPPERIHLAAGPLIRDAIVRHVQELAKLGPLNSPEHPLVSPDSPRAKFEKTAVKKKGKGKRKKHRRSRKRR